MMSRFFQTICVLGILFSATAWGAQAEEAAIRAPLENYMKGHATGDREYFRKAFHPQAVMWGKRGDTLVHVPIEEYIARAGGSPAADEAQRKRWVEMVQQTGDTAVAKIVLDYPTAKFVDTMTLLKLDGEWKIVNKIFHLEPKQ